MATDDLTCQYCGRELGNAGAQTTHERSCDHNPANQAEAQAPATRQTETQTVEVAPREQSGGEIVEATQNIAALADSDMPTQSRLGALQTILAKGQAAIEGYQNYRREKLALQEDRANNLELVDPEDVITCESCGYEITPEQIPLQADRMRCPNEQCQKVWDLKETA